MPPTLNIAALTRRTGVPADTIRKWEQRYGVLCPARTAGGQRRYTEVDVARIEWLKARLEEGYRISEAAALLGSTTAAPTSPGELRTAFVDATRASNVDALGRLVDQALALAALDEALTGVLAPALVEIGEQWAAGEISVAQEHLASSAVRCALQKLLADARASVRGVAVLACAPGEQHEIGLMMLAVLLRSDGWQVAFLGADTPLDDAFGLAATIGASALCFSAATAGSARDLRDAIDGRRVPETLNVTIGGRGTDVQDLAATVDRLRALAA
jgi:MerR family transcriptional regulator, light-induced transcriptional regulator